MADCHCGEPGVAKCPCCDRNVCVEHLQLAANALAVGVGISSSKGQSEPEEERVRKK